MRPETPEEQRDRFMRFAFPDTDDIRAEAQVQERDKSLALRFWQKWGTPLLRALLRARKEE